MTKRTGRAARALLLLCLAGLLSSCSFFADEFSVLDRAAPKLLAPDGPTAFAPGP